MYNTLPKILEDTAVLHMSSFLLKSGSECVISVISNRLLAHQDDPDIDDPFTPPQGHTLGQGIYIPSTYNKCIFKNICCPNTLGSVQCQTRLLYLSLTATGESSTSGESTADSEEPPPSQPQSLKCDEYVHGDKYQL